MSAGEGLFAAADVRLAGELDPRELVLDQTWLRESQATELHQDLLTNCSWQLESIAMYGRRVSVPRLTAWYGDSGLNYRYSGLDHIAHGWLDSLAGMRDQLSEQFGQPFNFVLLNRYRDGRDYMGWHSDDEASVQGGIASVSLGRSRRFSVRTKAPAGKAQEGAKPGPISSTMLASGSLLFMPAGFQQRYLHALPKTSDSALRSANAIGNVAERLPAERLNLTFRWLRKQA